MKLAVNYEPRILSMNGLPPHVLQALYEFLLSNLFIMPQSIDCKYSFINKFKKTFNHTILFFYSATLFSWKKKLLNCPALLVLYTFISIVVIERANKNPSAVDGMTRNWCATMKKFMRSSSYCRRHRRINQSRVKPVAKASHARV